MEFQKNIYDLFKAVHEADKSYIEPWMVNWSYQDHLTKRDVKYKDGLPQSFYHFNDPKDIGEWMNWLKVEKPDFFQDSLINPLIEKSTSFDRKMIEKHQIDFDFEGYEAGLARNNAQDYIMANMYPMPGPSKGRRVLDFGSGFGRQANLWNQMEDDKYVHISMDAIPKSYCLQHFYYSNIDRPNFEYAILKDELVLDDSSAGIYHIPTWRFDLIPDNYLDKIVVVQVLQEINEKLVKHVLKEFHRVLKPTGSLYIRDHGNSWRPAHKINIDQYLVKNAGFTLEYKMHAVDRKEVHGIPRIFRKTNPEVKKQEQVSMNQIIYEKQREIDSATNGKLKKIFKSLIGK